MKILSELKETVEILLSDADLAMIDEVDDGLEVGVGDTTEVDERMLVVVPLENSLEERTGGTEDDFVSGNLLCVAGKRDVTKLRLFSDCLYGRAEVALKVVPLQTKFL